MALTLVENQRMWQFNSNFIGISYTITGDASYPSGGYTIDDTVFPDAENPFTKILGVIPLNKTISENGYFAEYTEDNTDTTNPEINVDVYEFPTGGGAPVEVSAGEDLSGETFDVLIIGIPAESVICDPC